MSTETLPILVQDAGGCVVCDHPARPIIEQFLLCGWGYHEIPKEVGEPETFKWAIRSHHFQRHIKEVERPAYLFMLVRHMQEASKLERRELEKSPERQNEAKLKRLQGAKQWVIASIARLEGYDRPQKATGASVKAMLEKLVEDQPKLAQRIHEVGKGADKDGIP